LADSENDSYSGVDGSGKAFILNINCMEDCEARDTTFCFDRSQCERENQVYPNAGFLPLEGREQFFYGQIGMNEDASILISYASSLTIVAHEIFHAITYFQSNKNNEGVPPLGTTGVAGSLNESYSDIFAIFILNRNETNIIRWDWNICDPENRVIRSLASPDLSQFSQATHMNDFRNWSGDEDIDNRNMYFNHGIHNLAVHKIITAKYGTDSYLFANNLEQLVKMFYGALKEIGINPDFSSSRASILKSANIFFSNDRNLPEIEQAINDAFDQVGVNPASTIF
jgi:Zn-dependent metalloprotease